MEKENQNQTGCEIVKNVIAVRPANEEGKKWFLTVGSHKASEKIFDTKEKAITYANEPHWDTLIAVVAEMLEIYEKAKQKNTEK